MITYIQSGNVIFSCGGGDTSQIAGTIEAALSQSFGYDISVFIRSKEDFQGIIAGNPFLKQRHEDPANLHVTFLADSPSSAALSNVLMPPGERDEFQIVGKEIYVFCPNGYGGTKFANAFFEQKLGVAATTRNWKTVKTLYEIVKQN